MTRIDDLRALRDALALLAADAETQLEALSVLRRVADELRAGVEELQPIDRQLRKAGLLPQALQADIARIDAALDEILDDASLWTAAALRSAPAWHEVRRVARTALQSLEETHRGLLARRG